MNSEKTGQIQRKYMEMMQLNKQTTVGLDEQFFQPSVLFFSSEFMAEYQNC